MKRTARGFAIFAEFKDSRAADVRVQRSSDAGGEFCWVFVSGGSTLSAKQRQLHEECKARGFAMPGSEIISADTSAHLNRAQAKKLIKALQKFVEGEA